MEFLFKLFALVGISVVAGAVCWAVWSSRYDSPRAPRLEFKVLD